jgi:hypothetical protein
MPIAAAAKMVGHTDSKITERCYYELSRDQRQAIQPHRGAAGADPAGDTSVTGT